MKNKFINICILPFIWSIYTIFELFSGRISNIHTLVFNIFLVFLFFLVNIFIYTVDKKYPIGITKSNNIILLIIILLGLDQGIKLIIKLFYFNSFFPLIDKALYFSPIINTNGSWLNARFGTSLSFTFLIIINLIAIFLFTEIYRYYHHNGNKSFSSDMAYIFILSGAICSLIDKFFYGGSLDFIGVNNLFVADIKDIYINIGIVFFIMTLLNENYLSDDTDSTIKDDLNSLIKFIKFIRNDIFKK
ncbi:signal peptidase II [Clostridium sp. BJN0001]|uniref:signal peptidase II n=1 Tax=Clostridium sp. BJN0001 TaxID=2930219 RepID=UPI001FD0DC58|nr:signal peptidase II [Clostridium sp. BJN0001]